VQLSALKRRFQFVHSDAHRYFVQYQKFIPKKFRVFEKFLLPEQRFDRTLYVPAQMASD
jgi:hypothetical protein